MWFLPSSKQNSAVNEAINAPEPEVEVAVRPDRVTPLPQARAKSEYEESQAVYVTLIFFAAITLRILFFVLGPYGDSERAMYPDSYRYVELGETLVSDGVFGITSPETGVVHEPLYELREELGQLEPSIDGGLRPEIMRTPGYPALLGLVAWSGVGINGLLIAQCLFGAISVVLVYGIGRVLLKRPGPALFAAAIVAIHPAALVAPTSVLTESSFTLLILLGLWAVADREKRGIGRTTFGGMMIGLSVLVRPVSIFLGPAVAIWMFATDRRFKTAFLAILMLGLSLAPAVGWMARNNSIGFGYRLSSIPYINTYFYTDAYMRITEQGGDWKQDWPATVDTLMGELKAEQNLNPHQDVYVTMEDLGVQAIKDDPGLYGKVMQESMIKFFTDHSLGGMYQQLGLTYTPSGLRDKLMSGGFSWQNLVDTLKNPTGWLALSWSAFNGLLLIGMILGSVMLLVRRHWPAFLLLGGVMFYFAFATQATGLERFRLPVLGIQALLVASLFAPRRQKPQKSKDKTPKRRWYERAVDGDEPDDEAKSDKTTPTLEAEPEPESLARPI